MNKNCIFNRCLNVSRDDEEVMCEGKSFHIQAPVTIKANKLKMFRFLPPLVLTKYTAQT